MAMQTSNSYSLPIDLARVTKTSGDSIAHVDGLEHAIDYDAPEGTPVLAALGGRVIAERT